MSSITIRHIIMAIITLHVCSINMYNLYVGFVWRTCEHMCSINMYNLYVGFVWRTCEHINYNTDKLKIYANVLLTCITNIYCLNDIYTFEHINYNTDSTHIFYTNVCFNILKNIHITSVFYLRHYTFVQDVRGCHVQS